MNESWRKWVMAHIELWRTDEWGMSHIWTSLVKDFYEWVMAHRWMSRVARMNEAWGTHEWVMLHMWMSLAKRLLWMSLGAHMNEPWGTDKWVMSHIWTSLVRDFYERVPWLIHMCAMTPQEKSLDRVMAQIYFWRCDVIHMSATTHSYVRHDSSRKVCDSVMAQMHFRICDVIHMSTHMSDILDSVQLLCNNSRTE